MQKGNLEEEKVFNMRQFWGSSSIAPHVDFRRGSEMYCVYCGEKSNTREHCPSKCFLKKPLPTDLPTVPACKKCNNSFSSDERYTKKVIDFLYMYYIQKDYSFNLPCKDDDRETKEAREAAQNFIIKPYFDERMANVFRKLAICHAAYEISVGFFCDEWQGKPEYVSYVIRPMVGDETWKNLEYAEVIDDFLPEIGSRVFGNIYVIQLNAQDIDKAQQTQINVCLLDWTDIQNGYYKYQAFLREGKIFVKIIFYDFLYVEVVFAHEKKMTEK
jgi:hypothetical protein